MSRIANLANKLSFAHLGLRSSRAESDEPPADDKKSKRAKGAKDDDEPSAEDEDDDVEASGASAEGDDPEDDEDDVGEKKGKKAKAGKDDSGKGGDEDDDSDEEMRGKSAVAAARTRERARCAAIFASPHAQGREAFAAHLAFNTLNTRADAIALLKNAPSAAAPAPATPRAAHPGRSAQNPNVTPNAAPPKSKSSQIAALWDQAHEANSRAGRREVAEPAGGPRRR